MLIKKETDCLSFIANDGCRIRELLHPKNDRIELGFSLAIAEIEAGGTSYRHRLKQDEVYYILEGSGDMHIDEEICAVSVGDAIHIPGGCEQWIDNTANITLKFAAIVSPPWRDEDDIRAR